MKGRPVAAHPCADGGFDNAITSADPSGKGGFLGSWSTPVIVPSSAGDVLIVTHALRAIAYEPRTGREVWSCGGLPEQAFASPAVGEGVIVAAGHKLAGGGTRLTGIRLGGHGDVTATHRLWQTDLPKECVGSGVIVGRHFYAVTQFGSIFCIDVETGKKLTEKRLAGRGSLAGSWSSLVAADGKLLVPNHSGEVFIFKATPELEMLASNSLADEPTCASLALSDGELFLRTYKSLWCIGPPRK